MDKLKELQDIIDQSQRIVFSVGQASQQSPISLIFGSSDGVYSVTLGRHFTARGNWSLIPCLSVIQRTFSTFTRSTCSIQMPSPMQPIAILAWLEETGKLKAVVTQNIDSLHEMDWL